MALNYMNTARIFTFRSEIGYTDLEKRQLFLRSYQFSRKQTTAERIKRSLFRLRKVMQARFRSARKLRKMLWLKLKLKLKNGLFVYRRRRYRTSGSERLILISKGYETTPAMRHAPLRTHRPNSSNHRHPSRHISPRVNMSPSMKL